MDPALRFYLTLITQIGLVLSLLLAGVLIFVWLVVRLQRYRHDIALKELERAKVKEGDSGDLPPKEAFGSLNNMSMPVSAEPLNSPKPVVSTGRKTFEIPMASPRDYTQKEVAAPLAPPLSQPVMPAQQPAQTPTEPAQQGGVNQPAPQDRFKVFGGAILSPLGREPLARSAPSAPLEHADKDSLGSATPTPPSSGPGLPNFEPQAKPKDMFFSGKKEASKWNIKKLFTKNRALKKEIRYGYGKYKLKQEDVNELQQDLRTKFGKGVDRKEYIKEINKIIEAQHHQKAFDPKGYKEILKLREEERLLKKIGGLESQIGKHKKLTPRYDWSKLPGGQKNIGSGGSLPHRQDFLKNIGRPGEKP